MQNDKVSEVRTKYMRVAIFQPPYPVNTTKEAARNVISYIIKNLEKTNPKHYDLIVLPEYSNVPGLEKRKEIIDFLDVEGNNFRNLISKEALRLKALISFGEVCISNAGLVNQTVLFDPDGNLLAVYKKTHLTESESNHLGIIAGYNPVIVEWKNIRISFISCFDIYFPEFIERIASSKVDILINPAYQRSESIERIRFVSQCRALDSGSYLLRSSYSMGTAQQGGNSMIVSPCGNILAISNSTGMISAEIDPKMKFIKPASYREPVIEHRALIEKRRRPGIYRSEFEKRKAILKSPYPHICAHRGLSYSTPENTMPAFGAAIALGVHEIELDLWLSKDGIPVICHDPDLKRIAGVKSLIKEMNWKDIKDLDCGVWKGTQWQNIRLSCFDEVVEFIDGRVIMNIHIKDPGIDGKLVKIVSDIIHEKCLIETSYIAGEKDVLAYALKYAYDIDRACLDNQDNPEKGIKIALNYKCSRIQFRRNALEENIKEAKKAGLICNLFYSNDPQDAKYYVSKGIDVILTDCANVLINNGFPCLINY